jgi:peptide/nickel transport system substrate-binding protein
VGIKQLTMVTVPEAATRVAMLERGEADIIYNVPGELIDRIKSNPKLTLAPVLSANFWLEFPGFQDPKSPFHDKRVRQAVSLAVDRDAMNEAECGGLGKVDGNWINDDVVYGMPWPKWPHDPAKAKQLLAEAGFADGFNVDWVTPLPDSFSRGERIVSMLRKIGIRGKLQVMERGIFLKQLQGGLKQWPGTRIILNAARIGGTWSNWYDSYMKCGGFNGRDRNCVPELDAEFVSYLAATEPEKRQRSAEQIQREILDNHYFVPVFRHAAMQAFGPRIEAAKWQDVFPTITTAYAYPWEDIRLKDSA